MSEDLISIKLKLKLSGTQVCYRLWRRWYSDVTQWSRRLIFSKLPTTFHPRWPPSQRKRLFFKATTLSQHDLSESMWYYR